MMKQLEPRKPLYAQVLKDFRRWSADQNPHTPGMVGQTESHFPCKAAYAVAVFDHDEEKFKAIKVMVPASDRVVWRQVLLYKNATHGSSGL